MEARPIQVSRHWDVANQVLVRQDLALQEVQLRLTQRAHPCRQRLLLPVRSPFQDVVVQRLKLIAVAEVITQHLLGALE